MNHNFVHTYDLYYRGNVVCRNVPKPLAYWKIKELVRTGCYQKSVFELKPHI